MASDSDSAYDSAADQNPNSLPDTPINHQFNSAIDDHLSSLTLTPLNDAVSDLAPSQSSNNVLDANSLADQIEAIDRNSSPEFEVSTVETTLEVAVSSEVVVVVEERENNLERESNLESDGGVVVWREVEGDAVASPSSSGYAGERGSSSASSASGIEEIEEHQVRVRDRSLVNGIADSQPAWIPGKRHENEVCLMVSIASFQCSVLSL